MKKILTYTILILFLSSIFVINPGASDTFEHLDTIEVSSTTIAQIDGPLMDAVQGLPDQLEAAWARVAALALPDDRRDVDAVVVAGMGGSAIGGDLAASLFADALPVPMQVTRDYVLPGWVGPRTLVIGSSFVPYFNISRYAWTSLRGGRQMLTLNGPWILPKQATICESKKQLAEGIIAGATRLEPVGGRRLLGMTLRRIAIWGPLLALIWWQLSIL